MEIPRANDSETDRSSLRVASLGLAEALWLLMVVMTPLFVNLWVEQQFEASKVWLLRTLIWLLALVWLRGWLAGHRFRPLAPTVGKVAVALALVLSLATLLSPHPYIALFGSLDRANGLLTQLSFLLLFAIVAVQFDPDHHWRLSSPRHPHCAPHLCPGACPSRWLAAPARPHRCPQPLGHHLGSGQLHRRVSGPLVAPHVGRGPIRPRTVETGSFTRSLP